ncbi:interferon-induced very large GTPase 1-like isoform X2 [Mytilus edulis]
MFYRYSRNSTTQTRLILTSIISVLIISVLSSITFIIKTVPQDEAIKQGNTGLLIEDARLPFANRKGNSDDDKPISNSIGTTVVKQLQRDNQNRNDASNTDTEKDHSEGIEMVRLNAENTKELPIDSGKLSSLENFINYIGLIDFYPNKLQIRDVMKVQFLKVPLDIKDIALKFAADIIMLNFKGRDTLIQERLIKRQMSRNNISSDILFNCVLQSTLYKSDNITINPLDLISGVFKCSSPILKSTLASKLFICKLSVPFILPKYDDEVVSLSILPLRSIIIDKSLEYDSSPNRALDCPCHVVSFVRIGRVSVSKSKLANAILSEQYHNTFFNRDCPLGTTKRCISDGLVEAAWYVPSKSNVQNNSVTMFLNLRGDGIDLQDQLHILSRLSSVCIIMTEVNSLQDESWLSILDYVHANAAGVILAVDGMRNDDDEIGSGIELYRKRIHKYEEKTKFCVLSIDGDIIGIADIKHDIKVSISALVNNMPLSSIYERILLSKHITDEDKQNILSVRKTVQKMKDISLVSVADLKQKIIPGQCKQWIEKSIYSDLSRRTIDQVAASEEEIIDANLKQVTLLEKQDHFMNTFIRSCWNLIENENQSQVFLLLVQSLLDERNRRILPDYQAQYLSDWQSLKSAKENLEKEETLKMLEKRTEISAKELSNVSIGFEHLCIEMGHIFEALTKCDTESQNVLEYLEILPKLAAKQLLMGQPFQLMDGDVGKKSIPIIWIKAVFCELNCILGERKCLVVSVLGIQSSGKSTLLNTMFGLNFTVTAGRCTRGMYVQLVDGINRNVPSDIIIVVDTEGLTGPEFPYVKAIHDNELATFIVGMSDMTIVNIKGENTMEITNVLQPVVKAILNLKKANTNIYSRQKCIFAHQNVPIQNVTEKLRNNRQKFVDFIDEMTLIEAKKEGLADINTFNEIMQLDVEADVWYLSDLWLGNPPMAPANPGYSETAAVVRKEITNRLLSDRHTYRTLTELCSRIEDIWKAM